MGKTLRVISDGWREFLGFSGFDLLCEVDREGRYLAISPNYAELLGYDPERILGRTPFELGLIHPADLEPSMEAVRPLFESSEQVRFEYRFQDGDGSWRWMESTGNAFLTPSAEWRALIISRDITERKRAEASLAANEERYRLVFEHAPLGLLHFDSRGILQVVNDTYVAQMGSSREVMTGLDMRATLRDPGVIHAIQEALEGRRGFFEGEYVSVTGGRSAFLKLHTYSITAGDGQLLGGIGIVEDISERHRMEEALRKESGMLLDIIEHNPMSIQVLDREGFTLSVNAAHTRLFQAVPPPDYSLFRDPLLHNQGLGDLLRRMQEGQVVLFPEFYHNPHEIYPEFPDCPVWIRMVAFPILGADGAPERFVIMHEDITARRAAEKALETESAFLRSIIEHNPMSLQVLGMDGRTQHVNAAFIKLFGNVPPSDYSIFSDPLALKQGLGDLLTELRNGSVVYFPVFFHNPHDIYPDEMDMPVWVWMVGFPILGPDGRPERYVLMHSDVTEQRMAEQAMRESEAKYREFVEGTDDIVTQVDGEGHFLYVNRAAGLAFGLSPEACVGRLAFDVVHPDDRAFTQAAFHGWIVNRTPSTTLENRCISETGEVHDLLWTINLHFDANGVTQINSIARDITQVKQTEEILRQAQKLESLGVLAGGIAHDFNNLLTAILGNLNLAQLKLSPESPAQFHLEAVERTVLKASDLTRQMLAYSGKGRFVVRSHDLNEVVQEMVHLLHVSISKKIALRLKLMPDLPPIEADGAQIQQVIMNLVTNASDAIGDREGIISLTTSVLHLDEHYIAQIFSTQNLVPGRYITLEVSDTGCGINPEIIEKIFDPFFTTKTSGRGLGLSAMLGILRGHGGGFKIYSELGRGTTFKIFLPQGTSAPAAPEFRPPEDTQELQGLVLLVDDEPTIRESLQAALESFGMRVITAIDGQDALERFREDPDAIDLVLMDLTMPRMDGREAFLEMCRIRPQVPVILSSGYNEQESIREFLGKGLAGFIQKPYRLSELRKKVLGALRRE